MVSQLHIKSILALIFIVAMIIPVSATITVSGTTKFMQTMAPGQNTTFPITLTTDTASDYDITILGFKNGDNGGYVGVNDPTLYDTTPKAKPSIAFNEKEIHLESGKPTTIDVIVSVPDQCNEGLYALINIHPKVASSSGASIVTAINVPVMVTVSGVTLTETGKINNIEFKDSKIATTFTNTGNHHYYGAINEIVIIGAAGKETKLTNAMDTAIVPGGKVIFVQTIDGSILKDGTITTSNVRSSDGKIMATMPVTVIEQKDLESIPQQNNVVSPEEKDEINDAVDRSTLIAAAIIVLVVIGCIGYFVLIRNRN